MKRRNPTDSLYDRAVRITEYKKVTNKKTSQIAKVFDIDSNQVRQAQVVTDIYSFDELRRREKEGIVFTKTLQDARQLKKTSGRVSNSVVYDRVIKIRQLYDNDPAMNVEQVAIRFALDRSVIYNSLLVAEFFSEDEIMEIKGKRVPFAKALETARKRRDERKETMNSQPVLTTRGTTLEKVDGKPTTEIPDEQFSNLLIHKRSLVVRRLEEYNGWKNEIAEINKSIEETKQDLERVSELPLMQRIKRTRELQRHLRRHKEALLDIEVPLVAHCLRLYVKALEDLVDLLDRQREMEVERIKNLSQETHDRLIQDITKLLK